jgi:hypothetical protein
MNIEKRNYETPELTVHGTVEDLTLQGGGHFADMPIGVGDPVGPGNTGSHP